MAQLMTAGREISTFLLRVCHDLRTPVRGIRAHAELLIKEAKNGQVTDVETRLGFVVDGAKGIDLLVDGLAGYAIALQTDAASFQSTRTDVLLRGALAKLDRAVREHGAEITHGELPRVRGNPDRIMQVFEQLIGNALNHRGTQAPRVDVQASQGTDGWQFAVADNGEGVDAEDLERIFQPFERLHKAGGPGLGLAACRAIVEAHGGRIWAESQAGKGCTVFFTLPAG
jgi:signal transduction histidine kinase